MRKYTQAAAVALFDIRSSISSSFVGSTYVYNIIIISVVVATQNYYSYRTER